MFRFGAVVGLALVLAGAVPAGARPRPQLSEAGGEGVRLVHRGRWERAAAAFQRAVDGGHPTVADLAGLGYTSMKVKRYATAARAYERLCAAIPDKDTQEKVACLFQVGFACVYQ